MIQKIFSAFLLLLLLTSCTLPSGDELLAAPRPSTNYQTLQAELDKLLASGVTYVAPTSGNNRSTVQLMDLDGDGEEEVIAFFRGSSAATSSTLKVYIYKKQNDDYICTGSIESSGITIQSVEYPSITPSGQKGMVVTWKFQDDGINALTMCSFDQNCTPNILLETEYIAMELTDLTEDGAKDLLLITNNLDNQWVARLYQYNIDGTLELMGEAPTSSETVSIEKIKSGRIMDNVSAVFAEEKTTGGIGLTTDIFVYHGGALHNLALDGEDATSVSTYRPISVYSADINLDGITELPRAVLMVGFPDATVPEAIFMLDWFVYGVNQAPQCVRTTYQNVSDGWTLRIDEQWHDLLTAKKETNYGISSVTFYEYTGRRYTHTEQSYTELFTIFCITGSMREYYEKRSDLIQLGSTSKAVYVAQIIGNGRDIMINEDGIRERFSLIRQDWNN